VPVPASWIFRCRQRVIAPVAQQIIVTLSNALELTAETRRFAAMLAPHLSALLGSQSDFGQPAGDVLATLSFRTSPKIWLVAQIAVSARDVQRCVSCVIIWHRTD
jgi:hypothetical protein